MPAITARGSFTWAEQPSWFRNFTYAEERARGLDDGEDLASPGIFTWDGVTSAVLMLRAGSPGTDTPEALAAAEHTRRSRLARDGGGR